ncbi:MAG: YbaB/EbfC family nucleoid-associated protein [Bacilli bacterium]|nr:YbaB/EbfC family nucleoid-associated protein [Bacilli bacterium]
MNMQNIMAQAQKMKKEIEKKQTEIDNKVFLEETEFFLIKMNGKREILELKINSNLIKDSEDVEALEEMIKIGLKNILNQIEAEIESKMGMYGSNFNGLF